ncbi:MAG: helix-turn-helix transcriptional regulator [Pseudonocardiales bacterium]|nr:helix-turn-helix transcriptional regulator [Pseudonocardiales bacterium]MBV9730585.1 helix-turn-helix transcriptional regulator [Pseudonocardiales bacterium]
MNVTGAQDTRLSLETWNEPEMKRALADRDISSVYRLLRRVGISQRHIAALTGQSQSEVSEILKGRQVMAYDVLVRISNGLGIPRGYMGLAYDPATATSMVGTPDNADNARAEEDESVKRRNLLTHGAAMMFGTTVLGADRGQWLPSPAQTPAPSHIGMSDVKQVEATTRAMRALDYQFGGGTCRDAVVAQLSWAQRLLGATSKEEVRLRLFRALGDLQNLAGWTTFDVGLLDSARNHFATALEYAKQSGDSSLMSNIMYRIGRIYLHHREPNEALKWFQLGQIAAQNSGSEQAVAVLCANEAWAYAMLNDDVMAQKLLDRSQSELSRANLNDAPSWAKAFDHVGMYEMIGTVHTELAASKPQHAATAIPAFREALILHDSRMARSQAFTLGMLATSYLRQGDVDQGIQVSRKAVVAASAVNSTRVTDRLKPLEIEIARLSTNSDSRELCHRIRQLRSV